MIWTLLRRSDLWSGLLLVGLAMVIWTGVAHLPVGTLRSIGPGFFPKVLASMAALLGCIILARLPLRRGEAMDGWNPRPAILLALATGVFGLLIERAGLPMAVVASGAIASFAGADARPRELLVYLPLAAGVTSLVFVKALGLPIPVVPWLLP